MAVFKNSSSLISVLLLIIFSAVSSAASFRPDLSAPDIAGICDTRVNKKFCLDFLNSTPGMAAADLPGAGKIILDVSHDKAQEALDYVNTLLGQKPVDRKLNQSYETCQENYYAAVAALWEAKAAFATGDRDTANIEIAVARADADRCNDGVKGAVAAAAGVAELVERNEYLVNVLDVALVIILPDS